MSKLLQRGASAALRSRKMSSLPDSSKLTPEQLNELGRKLNPAQSEFGPKSKKIEYWQKFFQDPINERKPMFRRKGPVDDIVILTIAAGVIAQFAANVYCAVTQL